MFSIGWDPTALFSRILLVLACLQFHHEQAWIVSASDDQTVRIWNWQSRSCISILTGHSHYVMCARFHPRDDLLVSASLDQTIRVWNLTPLKNARTRAPPSGASRPGYPGTSTGASPLAQLRKQAQRLAESASRTAAGGAEAAANSPYVQSILDTHDRGVNWASFHPTKPFVVSAADDRSIKVWRLSEARGWEIETVEGHSNNVSCVLFHPHCDLIVSNSEDCSIRVWDGSRRTALQSHKRDGERYWILAAHPHQNLLAAGHDGGLLVFKLERERPAYAPAGEGLVFYSKDKEVRRAVNGAGSDMRVHAERKAASTYQFNAGPRTLVFNNHSNTGEVVLSHTLAEGGQYTIIDVAASAAAATSGARYEPRTGFGHSVACLSRTRFVVLDRSKQLAIKSLDNTTTKRLSLPTGYDRADTIFNAATPGRLLIRSEDRICLFETASMRVIGEITGLRRVRYVAWAPSGDYVALVTRLTVTLADKDLNHIATVRESLRAKSACWDENNILLYNTYTHLKYLVPEVAAHGAAGAVIAATGDAAAAGDAAGEPTATSSAMDAAERTADAVGIVRALPAVVYLVEARGGHLTILDRKRVLRSITYDATEPHFKRSLARREYADVVRAIRSGSMCGQAVLSYLQRAGYPEIAMHFVEDTATKFGLALECGDLGVAHTCAEKMKDADLWLRLARESTARGNLTMAEIALQQAKARDKLSFLYLATGERGTLTRMQGVAAKLKDSMGLYQTALALGDAGARVRVLESAGQLALAYASARIHGLDEDAERIAGLISGPADAEGAAAAPQPPDMDALAAALPGIGTTACTPPPCVMPSAGDWPQLEARRSVFDAAVLSGEAEVATSPAASGAGSGAGTGAGAAAGAAVAAYGEWGDENDDLGLDDDEGASGASSAVKALHSAGGKPAAAAAAAAGGWGTGDDDDLDLGDDLDFDGDDDAADAVGKTGAAAESEPAVSASFGGYAAPTPGPGFAARWASQGGALAAEHAAAGSFETAAELLTRQLGLATLAPLKDALLSTRQAAVCAIPTLPGIAPIVAPVCAASPASSSSSSSSSSATSFSLRPAVPITLAHLRSSLGLVYSTFESGNFGGTSAACLSIYATAPLISVASKAEEREVQEMLVTAREYKQACLVQLARKATPPAEDPKRALELAAYLTHCRLSPEHRILTLDLAMSISFKLKNFASAALFAQRLLESPAATAAAAAARVAKARKVVEKAQAKGKNTIAVDYDPRNPFVLCPGSLTPIYRGQPSVTSPFSGARYTPDFAGQVCRVDECSTIGEETTGLVCFRAERPDPAAMATAAASSASGTASGSGSAGFSGFGADEAW
jgi:coatomer protein complex subunit alpha (xenin)